MPKPRCSAEFIEGQLAGQTCVGCAGFAPDGKAPGSNGKAPRQMWATIPRLETPAVSAGAQRKVPPLVVDRLGRSFSGNWKAEEAAARINRPDRNPAVAPTELPGFGFLSEVFD